MKITIEQDALAAAVTYAARSLPSRPPAPVLAGLLLAAEDGQLRVSGFDYERSADTAAAATVTAPGRALVSGRLLADIVAAVKGDVRLELDGTRLLLRAGSARFTLPTLPLEEYPALPQPDDPSGTLPGPLFAEAVAQIATAVSRDDSLPALTGIGLRIDSSERTLTLFATDRYRYAVRILDFKDLSPDLPLAPALIPGKALLDAAKAAAADSTVDVALPGQTNGILSLTSDHAATTIRALEGELPAYEKLFPTEFPYEATVETAVLKSAVARVALVVDKKSPIRLSFTDNALVLEAGSGDDAQAVDNVHSELKGGELQIAFNPTFLIEGLDALGSEYVRFQFTNATKPAVLSGAGADPRALRYMLMPVRLTN
ncbi:DNA polymerase III subunit beta [Streptomyces sp. Edi4]|uniref:DNA polymerase III subunit beta n=1 Tax=Streptomyces sp. Edi4 TaxID=3162527 RepID=UPI003305E7C1